MVCLSVIIPVYNTEKYLGRCLDSVCAQTLSDIEIICVNDGSTDNSLALLQEYSIKDKRIKIINFEKNKGAAFSRNTAIDIAVGEYIGFVDSDDFIDVNFYEKLYNAAKENKADSAKGNYKSFENGIVDYELNKHIKKDKNNFAFAFCSAIYKRQLVVDSSIKFPELTDMEDPVFAFNFALQANKVVVVDEVNVYIVKRDDSATSGIPSLNQIKDKFTGLEMIVDIANSSKINEESYAYVLAFWFLQTFINSIKNSNLNIREYVTKNILKLYKNIKYKNYFNLELKKRAEGFCEYLQYNNTDLLNKYGSNTEDKLKLIKKLRSNIKNKVKVSVVIPVYNAQDYLQRCLDSICNQTLKEIEIICVNDGSTDNSMEILKKYASQDSRIKVINNEKNLGESVARNTGLDYAKGEYLAFVDNDDEIDLDFYEKLYDTAQSTGADIVKGDVKVFDYNGNIVQNENINSNIKNNKLYFTQHWWTAIYRTAMIKNNQIKLPEDIIIGGDLLFLNEAVLKANNVEIVENVYYYWYRRENSGDSRLWSEEKLKSALKIYDKITDNLNFINIEQNNQLEPYIYAFYFYATGGIYAAMHVSNINLKQYCAQSLINLFAKCKNKRELEQRLLKENPSIYNSVHNQNLKSLTEFLGNNNSYKKLAVSNRIARLRQNVCSYTREKLNA